LLTQLDGIGVIKLEELERKEQIEMYKYDMMRQIAYNTGQPVQVIRLVNRRQFNPNMSSLTDSRSDSDYQDLISEIGSLEYASNASSLARIRAMGDEASAVAQSSIGIGDRLAGLSV
ncbi:MAG: hypothetical protein ACKPKO_11215, partial [Candidatus Fonsibacter sp.]